MRYGSRQPLGHEVVDEDADVGLLRGRGRGARGREPPRPAFAPATRPLRGGLLVAGRAVHLAGEGTSPSRAWSRASPSVPWAGRSRTRRRSQAAASRPIRARAAPARLRPGRPREAHREAVDVDLLARPGPRVRGRPGGAPDAGNRITLSSSDGQYRGPIPANLAVVQGRLAMCVPHELVHARRWCGAGGRRRRGARCARVTNENGIGSASPALLLEDSARHRRREVDARCAAAAAGSRSSAAPSEPALQATHAQGPSTAAPPRDPPAVCSGPCESARSGTCRSSPPPPGSRPRLRPRARAR